MSNSKPIRQERKEPEEKPRKKQTLRREKRKPENEKRRKRLLRRPDELKLRKKPTKPPASKLNKPFQILSLIIHT